MRGLSGHFDGHHPIAHDSHNGMGFSDRKSCVEKRMRFCDEAIIDERVVSCARDLDTC
jgi:hypothetical protein